MNYPKFIITNQKEESISIQRVKKGRIAIATIIVIEMTIVAVDGQ